MMTTAEAKDMISREFIGKFKAFLMDWDELEDREFGRKYGFLRGEKKPRYTFDGLKSFMRHVYAGRTQKGWVAAGYEKKVIWMLRSEKWLSDYETKENGFRETVYYITQDTAREIWRAYKAG